MVVLRSLQGSNTAPEYLESGLKEARRSELDSELPGLVPRRQLLSEARLKIPEREPRCDKHLTGADESC
jgi:hypothetical protein